MTESEHFDQIAPLDGVYAQNPDGAVERVSDQEFAEQPQPQPVPPVDMSQAEGVRSDLIPDWDGTVLHDPGPIEEPKPFPVALPLTPPMTEEDQATVAEILAAQREQLAKPAGNTDVKGAPHFARLLDDGREVCGQDGEPFPCTAYRAMQEEAFQSQSGTLTPVEDIPPIMAEAAAAMGISVKEFRQRLGTGG